MMNMAHTRFYRKPRRDSFRAYACEVAEVNIGRLNVLAIFVSARPDLRTRVDEIIESLRNMKHAAETGDYPGHV